MQKARHSGTIEKMADIVSDFEKYARRQKRQQALEQVLEKAREFLGAAKNGSSSGQVWTAMGKLKEAVEAVDKLPPPHKGETGR